MWHQMKYKTLLWTVIRGMALMIVAAVVAQTTMSFIRARGIVVSDKVHDIVMLVAIFGAFFLSMGPVIRELELLKTANKNEAGPTE